MLVNLNGVFERAKKEGTAIGAFNVSSWESAKAIIGAAEKMKRPVIMNYAPVHESFLTMEDAALIMLYHARKATVPVCVHLDHGSSFEQCMKAIRLGFTSVMIDASSLRYEENVAVTRLVVRAAHAVQVTVEAELGHIFTSQTGSHQEGSGIESAESFADLNDIYTSPNMAKDFVDATNVDALAIAFGTSHGIYVKEPVLDLERISAIRKVIDTPLVMHGGSGLSREEFQTAIKNGIRKINYYTYMALAGGEGLRKFFEDNGEEKHIFFHDIPQIAISAMEENLVNAQKIFSLE